MDITQLGDCSNRVVCYSPNSSLQTHLAFEVCSIYAMKIVRDANRTIVSMAFDYKTEICVSRDTAMQSITWYGVNCIVEQAI